MVAHVNTVAFLGVEARPVDVQVHIAGGLPAFNIVGLADKAVGESRERVRAALSAIGLALPAKRITINLSPADIPKEGSHYDLPIALGLLAAMEVVPEDCLMGHVVLGELGLDGRIQSVPGVLLASLYASENEMSLICPAASGSEAAWAGQVTVLAPDDLLALINHFKGTQVLSPPKPKVWQGDNENASLPDMRDIKGQETAKRALEVAAAGGHNLLMIGPPGAGKSMLASRLPGILPPLTAEEALEVSMISSISGELEGGAIKESRPFRSPHHSASMPALVGGGAKVRPGEISLAHHGVLFLDELPEFSRQTIEALRQPLETGKVLVARASAHITYPAQVQLVAAMNPCKCGYLDDASMACTRAPKCAVDYQMKISGPLFDRIDLHVDVPQVSASDLTLPPAADSSADVAMRVARARDIQTVRYKAQDKSKTVRTNAQLDGKLLEKLVVLDEKAQNLMTNAVEKMKLTARGYHRVLRVARTLADLDAQENVSSHHVAEALSYRRIAPQAM
ncbi:MAG: YifB family Mg chelatase-like AAA ATPase [Sphingomonadales bacterium]|nr:YifB family Mg chelatase-like AAA ATPase [Sphingomonadales bacterium]